MSSISQYFVVLWAVLLLELLLVFRDRWRKQRSVFSGVFCLVSLSAFMLLFAYLTSTGSLYWHMGCLFALQWLSFLLLCSWIFWIGWLGERCFLKGVPIGWKHLWSYGLEFLPPLLLILMALKDVIRLCWILLRYGGPGTLSHIIRMIRWEWM